MLHRDSADPPTRWDGLPRDDRLQFADKFDRLIADGIDVDGEARLADTLVPRAARILDAGSGTGRVGAALLARGHDVTAVEKDLDLVARSGRTHPGLPVVESDLGSLTPERLGAQHRPRAYDLVVAVGNVLVFLADGTERVVLGRLAALLAPYGRILVGLDLIGRPAGSRVYPVAELITDAASVGLVVELHAGTYDLRPPSGDYAVLVLVRNADSPPNAQWGRAAG